MNIRQKRKVNISVSRVEDPLLIKSRDKNLIFEVLDLIKETRRNGDKEILKYYRQKGINRKKVEVSKREISKASEYVRKEDLATLRKFRIRASQIARAQKKHVLGRERIQETGGFSAYLLSKPLEVVGVYIPRNLPSSLIFYCELARTAGVREVVLALPPEEDGSINPFLLAAARMVRINRIIAVGGLRAFPALAFGIGTGLIPDKLFGPASFYVDLVKQILQAIYKIPVDLASGPTEMAIYIDSPIWFEQARADLLAQLEHGPDSKCLVFTPSKLLFKEFGKKLGSLLAQNGTVLLVKNPEEALRAINSFSPEILEIFSSKPDSLLQYIKNASNIYVNVGSPLGDYLVAGKGCADPTFGMSRGDSGITLRSFLKTSCVVETTKDPLDAKLIELAEKMASIEKFSKHNAAIRTHKR